MMLKPRGKYWVFLLVIVTVIFSVILGSFLGSWLNLEPEEQALMRSIFGKLLPFPLAGAMVLVVIIGTLVSLLFKYYIIPILQLAEKARLITTVNPAYRITPGGAREVSYLAGVLNDAAAAFHKLQLEVDERVQAARGELQEERNRLAALMSELPGGVVVCNPAGQILLYNQAARQLLQPPAGQRARLEQAGAWIGLGRSIFGVLDREAILTALTLLQETRADKNATPVSSFMTTLANGTCLRIKMAPVFRQAGEEKELTGFVLTLEDMTRQIEITARRDAVVGELAAAVQRELGTLRQALDTLLQERPEAQRRPVEGTVQAIEQLIDQAWEDYSRHAPPLGKIDDVSAADLLKFLRKTVQERTGLEVRGTSAERLRLRLDSLALAQALVDLAGCLQRRAGSLGLDLELQAGEEGQALLTVGWGEREVPARLLEEWYRAPLTMDLRGRVLGLADLVADHPRSLELLPAESPDCRGLCLRLPTTAAREVLSLRPVADARPVYYTFDLFSQPQETELGRRQLRDLTYVVLTRRPPDSIPPTGTRSFSSAPSASSRNGCSSRKPSTSWSIRAGMSPRARWPSTASTPSCCRASRPSTRSSPTSRPSPRARSWWPTTPLST